MANGFDDKIVIGVELDNSQLQKELKQLKGLLGDTNIGDIIDTKALKGAKKEIGDISKITKDFVKTLGYKKISSKDIRNYIKSTYEVDIPKEKTGKSKKKVKTDSVGLSDKDWQDLYKTNKLTQVETLVTDDGEKLITTLKKVNSNSIETTKIIDDSIKNSTLKVYELGGEFDKVNATLIKTKTTYDNAGFETKTETWQKEVDGVLKDFVVVNGKIKSISNSITKEPKQEVKLPDFLSKNVAEQTKSIIKSATGATQEVNTYKQSIGGVLYTWKEIDGVVQSLTKSMPKVNYTGVDFSALKTNLKQVKILSSKTTFDQQGLPILTETWSGKLNGVKQIYTVINGQVKSITNEILNQNNEQKRTNRSTKKFGKLFKNIGKIVLYRAIRKAMAEIAKSVKESIQDIAKFSDSANKSMSQIVTATAKMKAGFGQLFEPIIANVAPIIESISKSFTSITNEISRANAQAQGLSEYTKISDEYAKDYAKDLSKASKQFGFDKFESLGDNEPSIYEKESVSVQEDLSESQNNLFDALMSIGGILKDTINAIQSIFAKIKPIIDTILGVFNSTFKPILEKLLGAIDRIVKPISNLLVELTSVLEPTFDDILPIIDIVANVLSTIVTLLRPIVATFKPLFELVDRILQPLLERLAIISGVLNLLAKLIEPIVNFVIQIGNKITSFATSIFGQDDFGARKGINDTINSWLENDDSWVNRYASSLDNASKYVGNIDYKQTTRIEIDMGNVNNNAISKELAKSMAEQFRKQNIKVYGA